MHTDLEFKFIIAIEGKVFIKSTILLITDNNRVYVNLKYRDTRNILSTSSISKTLFYELYKKPYL